MTNPLEAAQATVRSAAEPANAAVGQEQASGSRLGETTQNLRASTAAIGAAVGHLNGLETHVQEMLGLLREASQEAQNASNSVQNAQTTANEARGPAQEAIDNASAARNIVDSVAGTPGTAGIVQAAANFQQSTIDTQGSVNAAGEFGEVSGRVQGLPARVDDLGRELEAFKQRVAETIAEATGATGDVESHIARVEEGQTQVQTAVGIGSGLVTQLEGFTVVGIPGM